PSLSKSVDSDVLLDIAGCTLLLGRAEFCLVTCFAYEKVIFPKYLDGGIPPFVRRLFSDKLKKLEKNKDGELVQDKAAKDKATQPSVTIKYLELIFRGIEDKKVVPTFILRLVDDLAAWNYFPWGEYYWEEFHNKNSNPTTKLQPTDAEMGQKWYRRSYNYLDVKEKSIPLDDLGGVSQDDEFDAYTRQDGRGATVGVKVSGEAMNDADISAVIYVEETKSAREIVLENKVESLEAKVEKLQLDHDKMAVFFQNFKKIRPELVPLTPDAKEDPTDAAIDGEHMGVVGHPDENEGPNEKEDPSDAAIDGEHMDTIGSPDETKEPNAQEPISHVLNTPVDNGDVLMVDAPDTINLADPPSHESEITSPCGLEKNRDGLDGAKANQRNKKKGTLLQDFLPVIRKDGKEIKLKVRTEGMSNHDIFKKRDIDPKRYNITFEFSNHAPKQAGLYGDCGV
nr:hypothetical protein [Tanacetum cinerariifolium]